MSVSTTSANTTQSLQNYSTTSVVVEGPSTPLMTSHIILASPCSSSASSMFTEQPSSTYVIPSSPAVYSSMKLPESSPEPNSTQIYNLNDTPTISNQKNNKNKKKIILEMKKKNKQTTKQKKKPRNLKVFLSENWI